MSSSAGVRPLLVVVSSLSKSREYFFRSVSPHYRLWLFQGGAGRTDEVGWELPYLVGHTVVDTLDADAMTEAARAIPEEVAGILSYDEARIAATAVVAERLGLPTSPAEAVLRCRDKWLTRQALAAAGVPQAQSVAVGSPAEAVAAAERIGYPVVLKPRNLAASFGVSRADDGAELAAAYVRARSVTLPEAPERFDQDVLVEEFLDGPELSVDALVLDGWVEPLVVARKQTGFPPSFEETGHTVDAADPLLRDPELRSVLTAAHAAVGYTTGTTHTELRHTAGGLKVIEINGRLGGDMIPLLGRLATGTDVNVVAAAVATGQVPDTRSTEAKVAGIRFYYPDEDVTVGSLDVDEALLPAQVHEAVPLTGPGERVLLPPRGSAWESRLAHVIAVADTAEELAGVLDAAAKAVRLEPAAGPVPEAPVEPIVESAIVPEPRTEVTA
jgi:biotin carboxylase